MQRYSTHSCMLPHGGDDHSSGLVLQLGWTALHHAAWKGNLQVLELLLARGAHPCTTDKVGAGSVLALLECTRVLLCNSGSQWCIVLSPLGRAVQVSKVLSFQWCAVLGSNTTDTGCAKLRRQAVLARRVAGAWHSPTDWVGLCLHSSAPPVN
jgi:ankyrin repeat protein